MKAPKKAAKPAATAETKATLPEKQEATREQFSEADAKGNPKLDAQEIAAARAAGVTF
jgi:hypothetical protein